MTDPEFIENQATRVPHFDEAAPQPSTPAGQIYFANRLARRAGPRAVRGVMVLLTAAVIAALVIEVL